MPQQQTSRYFFCLDNFTIASRADLALSTVCSSVMAPKRPSGTYKKGARKGLWNKNVAAVNNEKEKKLARENAELKEEIAQLRQAHIQSLAAALQWRQVLLDILKNQSKTELYAKYQVLTLEDTTVTWLRWVESYMDENLDSEKIWYLAQTDDVSSESSASASPDNSDETRE